MPCYHPNYVARDIFGRAEFKGPVPDGVSRDILTSPRNSIVPCGKCLGCKLHHSKEWADRMLIEFDHTKKAIFLTLTYNDSNVICSGYDSYNNDPFYTLNVRDTQCFWKRLRERIRPTEIRYYLAGEYGPSTGRPHYHAIVFGLDFNDRRLNPKRPVFRNELGQLSWSCSFLESAWGKGYISFSPFTWESAAYCARYTMKKQYGSSGEDYYSYTGQLPEFCTMSRRPGLGHYYLEDHPDFKPDQETKIFLNDKLNRREMPLPKSFLRFIGAKDPGLYDNIMALRSSFAHAKLMESLSESDEDYITHLHYLEVLKANSIAPLRESYTL